MFSPSMQSNRPKQTRDIDLDLLARLKPLSWLCPAEMSKLVDGLAMGNFKRHEVILGEAALASGVHILLTGVGSITCVNSRSERVMVALLAPGPIPEFPILPASQYRFRCEAYSDCRVGSVGWEQFDGISVNAPTSALRVFHQNNLKQWYRLLLRGASFLSLDLHQRIAITLLELCTDFGIEESRGTLLRIVFSQKDLANLVGASRPRVSEHLARLERDHLVIRQGRQLVVRVGQLGSSMGTGLAQSA